MKLWLLEHDVALALEKAPTPSQEQVDKAMAAIGGGGGRAERVLTINGSEAVIQVSGVLTEAPDFWAWLFGGGNALYPDILAAIKQAEGDNDVERVRFEFNSPGGEAQPVAGVGDAIAAMTKPTTAYVKKAASAAYWLATQTDSIVAYNRGSVVGSIGTVITMTKPSKSWSIDIASTAAPNKRPNPETAAGKKAIKSMLDEWDELFITAVAIGRNTSAEDVKKNYGKGATMLARKALAAGMLDSIEGEQTSTVTNAGASTMDREQLMQEYPALCNQLLDEGRKEGADKERDRVKFHLTMGEGSGAMDIAVKACKDGSAKDDGELMASYFTANRNKNDLEDREGDEEQLEGNKPADASEAGEKETRINAVFQAAAAAAGIEGELGA